MVQIALEKEWCKRKNGARERMVQEKEWCKRKNGAGGRRERMVQIACDKTIRARVHETKGKGRGRCESGGYGT